MAQMASYFGRILELDHSSKSRTLARQKETMKLTHLLSILVLLWCDFGEVQSTYYPDGCPSCTFPIACAMDICGLGNLCEEGLQCIQCPCGCDFTCGEYPG
ncbi:PREDICTED: uncharacterized protein LOC107342196 [Acropora digitifera]|uniref:uncharacterized protein LOC107342196 n=1 Tax=Acropora digitifera TaxID=70779 RepID=UPI00077A9B07|nr:PREDICTED: uncharacterized protein LOC107342196 [Acropora digitifera]